MSKDDLEAVELVGPMARKKVVSRVVLWVASMEATMVAAKAERMAMQTARQQAVYLAVHSDHMSAELTAGSWADLSATSTVAGSAPPKVVRLVVYSEPMMVELLADCSVVPTALRKVAC